jgi:hypothetical protein
MAMAWVKYPEDHDDYYVWLAVAVEIMGGVWSFQRIPPILGLLPCWWRKASQVYVYRNVQSRLAYDGQWDVRPLPVGILVGNWCLRAGDLLECIKVSRPMLPNFAMDL